MKKVILKISYVLSFALVGCIIGMAIYFYFADGIGWPGGISTGVDNVLLFLFFLFGIYWFITIPILLICLIYQICSRT